MVDVQVKATIENLNSFQPVLDYLGCARGAVEMFFELGKAISRVNHCQLKHMSII